MMSHLEKIKIKNYRLFQNVELKNLPPMVTLVGANGTGKSTFFDIFSFLKDALQSNIKIALDSRGKYKEVVSQGHIDQPIEITLQFRLEISGHKRLVTYHLAIELNKQRELTKYHEQPVIAREYLAYKRGPHGKPFHFLDFEYGKGYAINNEEDFSKEDEKLTRDEQKLDPNILAIKGLGQFERFKAARAFRHLIENWYISDFHVAAARPTREDGYAEHLSTSGDNLAQVTQFIYENHRDRFNKILQSMAERVPGVSKVEAVSTVDGRLVLRFQDGALTDPFIARYVSDGTIKMFAYLVLLNDAKPFPLLAIEGPENQLYPHLLPILAEQFRHYAKQGGQVFISTHSPDFLNALKLEEVYCLRKERGFTEITCASDSELLCDLYHEGDLPGSLWKQGLFEGVNKL
jgi:predicted ATPase